MATEGGSNLHDNGGGRTDNRPAYSCHSRQKAGSILERSLELGAAGAGTTNRRRSHPAAATAACSLSKASGVQPVATKMLSVASDKVNR